MDDALCAHSVDAADHLVSQRASYLQNQALFRECCAEFLRELALRVDVVEVRTAFYPDALYVVDYGTLVYEDTDGSKDKTMNSTRLAECARFPVGSGFGMYNLFARTKFADSHESGTAYAGRVRPVHRMAVRGNLGTLTFARCFRINDAALSHALALYKRETAIFMRYCEIFRAAMSTPSFHQLFTVEFISQVASEMIVESVAKGGTIFKRGQVVHDFVLDLMDLSDTDPYLRYWNMKMSFTVRAKDSCRIARIPGAKLTNILDIFVEDRHRLYRWALRNYKSTLMDGTGVPCITSIPLFARCSEGFRHDVHRCVQEEVIAPGSWVSENESHRESLYFVLWGQLEQYTCDQQAYTFGENEWCGLSPLLGLSSSKDRTLKTCEQVCAVLTLTRRDFVEELRKWPRERAFFEKCLHDWNACDPDSQFVMSFQMQFPDCSFGLLSMMLRYTDDRVYAHGEPLMLRGEPGNSVIVLLCGECDIEVPGIPTLGSSAGKKVFGEVECLTLPHSKRTATVRASSKVVYAKELPKSLLLKISDAYPIEYKRMRQTALKSMNKLGFSHDALKVLPVFSDHWTDDFVNRIDRAIDHRIAHKGDVLVHEGQSGDEVFIVLVGDAEVWVNKRAAHTLNTGWCFGECNFLGLADVYTSSLVCTSPTVVTLVISRAAANDAPRITPDDMTTLTTMMKALLRRKAATCVENHPIFSILGDAPRTMLTEIRCAHGEQVPDKSLVVVHHGSFQQFVDGRPFGTPICTGEVLGTVSALNTQDQIFKANQPSFGHALSHDAILQCVKDDDGLKREWNRATLEHPCFAKEKARATLRDAVQAHPMFRHCDLDTSAWTMILLHPNEALHVQKSTAYVLLCGQLSVRLDSPTDARTMHPGEIFNEIEFFHMDHVTNSYKYITYTASNVMCMVAALLSTEEVPSKVDLAATTTLTTKTLSAPIFRRLDEHTRARLWDTGFEERHLAPNVVMPWSLNIDDTRGAIAIVLSGSLTFVSHDGVSLGRLGARETFKEASHSRKMPNLPINIVADDTGCRLGILMEGVYRIQIPPNPPSLLRAHFADADIFDACGFLICLHQGDTLTEKAMLLVAKGCIAAEYKPTRVVLQKGECFFPSKLKTGGVAEVEALTPSEVVVVPSYLVREYGLSSAKKCETFLKRLSYRTALTKTA